jgi:hypothetical protein
VNIEGQPLKAVGIEPEQKDTFLRSCIDTIVRGQQSRYVLVAVVLGNAVGVYLDAVVAAEAVVGAEPQIAVFVLHNISDGIRKQSVFHADVPIWVIYGSPTLHEGQ